MGIISAFSEKKKKKSWDNTESRKMTDWSSQKAETTYLKCNYIMKDIKNGLMGKAFLWGEKGIIWGSYELRTLYF